MNRKTIDPVERYRHKIERYARSFIPEKGKDRDFIRENIELKINHTYRVTAEAGIIADGENFNSRKKETALLCALFHDIGRFRQFSEYLTFVDGHSVNHAELGTDILKTGNILDENDICLKNTILTSTLVHNMQDIPDRISAEELPFVKLTRDADKLDILEMFCEYHNKRKVEKKEALEIGLPDTEGYSPEIIDMIMQNRTIPNSMRRNYNDMMLVHLAWVLNLNFRTSLRMIMERKTIDRLARYIPEDRTTGKLIRYLKDHAAKMSL